MNKLKFYIWDIYWSSMIGLAVFIVGLLIEIRDMSFHKIWLSFLQDPLNFLVILFINMFFCMAVGAVIGAVSLFFIFQIFLKLIQKPLFGLLIGFISNFLIVAVLNIVGAFLTGVRDYQQFVKTLWFWALPVSEALSFFLIIPWYKRFIFYKEKLEQKKILIRNQQQCQGEKKD